jgi:hypothetical protein
LCDGAACVSVAAGGVAHSDAHMRDVDQRAMQDAALPA